MKNESMLWKIAQSPSVPLKERISAALDLIKIDNEGWWFIPSRGMLNMTIEEFIEFDRARIIETKQKKTTKYKYHYGYYDDEE